MVLIAGRFPKPPHPDNSECLAFDKPAKISCPYRKSNPLAVDRELGDATARCRICAN